MNQKWVGDTPRGVLKVENTYIGYKWLQNLIITCWYGYCGYGEVGCDPKMGGGPPQGVSFQHHFEQTGHR